MLLTFSIRDSVSLPNRLAAMSLVTMRYAIDAIQCSHVIDDGTMMGIWCLVCRAHSGRLRRDCLLQDDIRKWL